MAPTMEVCLGFGTMGLTIYLLVYYLKGTLVLGSIGLIAWLASRATPDQPDSTSPTNPTPSPTPNLTAPIPIVEVCSGFGVMGVAIYLLVFQLKAALILGTIGLIVWFATPDQPDSTSPRNPNPTTPTPPTNLTPAPNLTTPTNPTPARSPAPNLSTPTDPDPAPNMTTPTNPAPARSPRPILSRNRTTRTRPGTRARPRNPTITTTNPTTRTTLINRTTPADPAPNPTTRMTPINQTTTTAPATDPAAPATDPATDPATPAPPRAPPRTLPRDEVENNRLYEKVKASVVHITNFAPRRDVLEEPQGIGSGFVWDTQGHIVTNYHVIHGASRLRVTLADQTTRDANLVGFDQDKDVAVLRIDAPKDKLTPISVGISAGLVCRQKVFAIGSPFGFDQSVTDGSISGLNREISSPPTGRPIQGCIQTDAAINPGNSGGPLLDGYGNLIGINTAIYSPSRASCGVGFSIPVDMVHVIVDQLVRSGKVIRPTLGIKFAPDGVLERLGVHLGVSGVLVSDAPPDGPAGKAGLLSTKINESGSLSLGHIITSVNGNEVSSGTDLYRILDQCKVGETVSIQVLGGDQEEKLVVLGARVLELEPDEL